MGKNTIPDYKVPDFQQYLFTVSVKVSSNLITGTAATAVTVQETMTKYGRMWVLIKQIKCIQICRPSDVYYTDIWKWAEEITELYKS